MTATAGPNLIVFETVAAELVGYLKTVETVAAQGDDSSAASVARRELPALVGGLLAFIGQHAPDADGRCRRCRTGLLGRRVHAPCPVFLSLRLAMGMHEHTRTRGLFRRARASGLG